MNTLKRFAGDIKKYKSYVRYSVVAELKSEVAESRLGYLWWIIEPICLMFIYMFIFLVIFKGGEPYFDIFVFSGLTLWNFFNKTALASVKLITTNRNIVTNVYIPKYILVISKMGVNTVKFSLSLALIIILLIVHQVPVSLYVLYFFPLFILLVLITFAFSCIFLHCGVFVNDLSNAISLILRLLFYCSGVFFLIPSRVPAPYADILLNGNPLALLITEVRDALVYCTGPNLLVSGIWLAVSLVLSWCGIFLIYKYENTYVKVIK
jgi:ABC-type polysaccharide/polyol phosphate export permease